MHGEIKKSLINSTLAVVTLFLVSFLWENTVLLIFLLGAVSLAMLINEGNKVAVYLYAVAFLLGPLAEAIAIYFGVWNYTNPHLLGFSIWLPFVWGNAGLFFRRINFFLNYLLK
jgi:hypothetical protein